MKKFIFTIAILALTLQVSYAQVIVGGASTQLESQALGPFFMSAIGTTDASLRENQNTLHGAGIYFPRVDLTEIQGFGVNLHNPMMPNNPPSPRFATFFDGLIVYNVGSGEPHPNADIGEVEGGVFTPGFWFYDNRYARTMTVVPNNNNTRLTAGTWRPVGGAALDATDDFWRVGGNEATGTEPMILGVVHTVTPGPNQGDPDIVTGAPAPIIVHAAVRVNTADAGDPPVFVYENRAIMHIGHRP